MKKFDYIVSNPPFKLDFSDITNMLKSELNGDRLQVFLKPRQKIRWHGNFSFVCSAYLYSLKTSGKAAIVVPTGFLSNKESIELVLKNI